MHVDVIITSYNYARFLGAAIDSALGQTHPDVGVIVVDDGSTDSSPQVIAAYGDRITAILKENGGQASAFNAGFAAAQGELVVFLDSDDLLGAGAVARAVAALERQPDAAKIQWRMELAGADGEPTGTVVPPPHMPLPSGDMRAAELAHPFDIPWMATSGNAFPVATLARLLPMPEPDYRVNADWYLQHLTPLLGPIVSLPEIGALRRVHGDNAYEQAAADDLDLAHVRETIRAAAATATAIEAFADELRLPRAPGPLLSVSDIANRMISLRLDPARHPIPGDDRRGLLARGVRAARRREDVHPAMRAAFAAWFAAMAVAPRGASRQLGQWFLFPEQRGGLNRLLGHLHRGSGPTDPTA